MIEQIEKLIKEWHEAGRADFERRYENLNYDTCAPKRFVEKNKYVCLDEGTSGSFILDKGTLIIYRLKSKYGVPNFKKIVGKLGEVTGQDLYNKRWW